MKLSIVIPAYNVEQYIGNCLDSIFSQQIETDRLEVIVVNDGSKDKTEDIIKQYASKHPNLIYISQENQGQSVARNNGLNHATGDLIWYVDSDDATTENSIQTIFSYFEKYPNADFLTFDRIHYDLSDGTKKYCKSWSEKYWGWNLKNRNNIYEKPFSGIDAHKRLMASVPWFHVFKRDFLIKNNLFFTPNLINEDDEISMRYYFFAKEVRYIPFAHYVYSAMRPGSLTTADFNNNIRKNVDRLKTIETWEIFEKKYARTKKEHQYVNAFIHYKCILMFLANYKIEKPQSIFEQNKKMLKKKMTKTYFKSTSFRNFSFIRLIRFLSALWCPGFFEYTRITGFKKLLKK